MTTSRPPNEPTDNLHDKSQNRGSENLQENLSNRVFDNLQDRSQNRGSENLHDKSQNIGSDNLQENLSNRVFDNLQDKSQNRVFDNLQENLSNNLRNRSPVGIQGSLSEKSTKKIKDKIKDKSANKIKDKSANKIKDNPANRQVETPLHTLRINGLDFHFPFKPYPSQILSISKMIDAIRNCKSTVIESPTGTGKSLSMLMAVCGWLVHQQSEDVRRERDFLLKGDINLQAVKSDQKTENDSISQSIDLQKDSNKLLDLLLQRQAISASSFIAPDTFEPLRATNPLSKSGDRSPNQTNNQSHNQTNNQSNNQPVNQTNRTKFIICSRTHSQLEQLIAQLKKTCYTPKTNMLISKKFVCLNKEIKSDYNNQCREKIKKNECSYFTNKDKAIKKINSIRDEQILNESLKALTVQKKSLSNDKTKIFESTRIFTKNVLDLEDTLKLTKGCKACPYYTLRGITEQSDILFMPYNYVLDPNIRKSLDLPFKEYSIIIDEAHNIEDTLCEAGSSLIISNVLYNYIKELQILLIRFPEEKKTLSIVNFLIKRLMSLCQVVVTRHNSENQNVTQGQSQKSSNLKNSIHQKDLNQQNDSI
ncbi:regulator of telomere elongation helicase 1-like protein, partial [Pseudoloma neurophilia]